MTPQTPQSVRIAERRDWIGAALAAGAVPSLLPERFHAHNPVSSAAASYAGTVSAASAGTYLTLRTLKAFLSPAQ